MIYLLKFLLIASLLTNLVNSHGRVRSPKTRSEGQPNTDTQWCGFMHNQYYYNDGKCSACGWNGPDWSGRNTELTGPIVASYQSGQTILLTSNVGNHYGYIRVKLCKLNSSTDKVTHACFNQNSLKIKFASFSSETPSFNPNISSFTLDDYTVETIVRNNGMKNYNLTLDVELPAGLSCKNCVLQWEWRTPDYNCQLENGTEAIRKWSPEYQDSQCPQQVFRNCIDIEIKPTENMPPYISNRFLYRDNMPTVFGCHPFNNVRNDKEINKPIEKTNRTDVNKFVGGGLMCFMSEEMFKKGPYYENKEKVFKDFCPKCRENCMIPGKECPEDCFCRWYPKNADIID